MFYTSISNIPTCMVTYRSSSFSERTPIINFKSLQHFCVNPPIWWVIGRGFDALIYIRIFEPAIRVIKFSRGVAWWQRVWDLHSRSRVRVRACISCKSLGQPGFYSLTWAHKVLFPGGEVSLNPKKKIRVINYS